MRILLVRPGYKNLLSYLNLVKVEPLELEYLYSAAKELGHACQIYDGVIDKKSFAKVLKEFKPDMVGITGYVTHKDLMLDYAWAAKKNHPEVRVVIGGVHAELNYQDFFVPEVDYIVHSGGIKPLREILQARSPVNIQGICFQREDGAWSTNAREYLDPDSLPIPDRTFFYQHQNCFHYLDLKPCAAVKASYSCPHKCNFCYCCQLNGGIYSCRNVEKVVEEIAGIHCDNIWLVDDTFYVDREKVFQFARLIKEKGIRKNFIVYYRADFVAENPDLIALLKSVGLKIVLVGLEAFDDRLLNNYNKHTSARINEQCLKVLKENNVGCTGLFIVDIDAAREDFATLTRYVKKHRLKLSTAAILTPLPGTGQYESYKERLVSKNPKRWDFLHLVAAPGKMGRAEFYFRFYWFYVQLLFLNTRRSSIKVNYAKYFLHTIRGLLAKLLDK